MISLAFVSLSFAANEVSVELGSFHAPDPGYEVFSSRAAMGSWGARVGFGVTDRVSLLADWQHSGKGGRIETDGDEFAFQSALTVDQLSVGPRVGLPLGQLMPYATVQALGMRGRVRLDGDADSTDELDEWKRAALTGGGLAMAGARLVAGTADQSLRLSGHLEMGYGFAAPLDFGDYGSLSFHGFALRAGAGVVF
jgi:hypothetical protein